jgi:predicted transcriptional regulator
MEMSKLKNEIIDRINAINDEKQLFRIEFMIENILASSDKTDFWDTLPQAIIESIIEAEKEAETGDIIPHEQAMKEIKSKLHFLQ